MTAARGARCRSLRPFALDLVPRRAPHGGLVVRPLRKPQLAPTLPGVLSGGFDAVAIGAGFASLGHASLFLPRRLAFKADVALATFRAVALNALALAATTVRGLAAAILGLATAIRCGALKTRAVGWGTSLTHC